MTFNKLSATFVPRTKKLNEIVSTHIARKTFISLSLIKDIPIQDVMKMSGHTDFRSMKSYTEIMKKHIKEISKKWAV